MKTEIIIDSFAQHPDTGHISVRVKSLTTDGNSTWEGPKRTYRVDAVAFAHRFNSNLADFEAWVANEHKQYLGTNSQLLGELHARKGKVIHTIQHGGGK